MKSLPIVPPNGPDGSYLIGVEGVANSYPAGKQTHLYVDEKAVTCIRPDDYHESRCLIHLHASSVPVCVFLSAFEVHETLFPSKS